MDQATGKKTKYEIIMDDILTRIRNNDFSYDVAVCTEKQLMEQYDVSRITAIRAITDLEQRGLLYRKRGVGSFVTHNALDILNGGPKASAKSKMVSLLLPFDMTQGGLFDAVKMINESLNAGGYLMSIYVSDISATKEKANIRLLLSQNISGLIYYPMRDKIYLELLNEFIFNNIPVVVIDKVTDCPYIHNVVSDNFEGGRLLTEHLISLGHTNIGFLTTAPVEETSSVRNRLGGYLKQLSTSGILPNIHNLSTVPYDVTEEDVLSGQSQFCNAIRHMYISGVTAILSENDRVAQLAILACKQMHLRVPEDISICGFDDSDLAKEHQITSVRQDFRAIGEQAGNILLSALSSPAAPASKATIPVELVIRTSTAAPREGTPSQAI